MRINILQTKEIWIISCLLFFGTAFCKAQININTGFPGANIIVDSIIANKVYLQPNQKGNDPLKQSWFYWNFKATSGQDEKVEFIFNYPNSITRKGPAISTDEGKTWTWMFSDSVVNTDQFSYNMPKEKEIWFSVSVPYNLSDFHQYLSGLTPEFKSELVTDTSLILNSGRNFEILKINYECPYPEYTIMLFSRHHACETSASFVVEGLINQALEYSIHNEFVRNHVRFVVFPFMDLDGVENGEQGKGRMPHDHNRDYIQFKYESTGYLKDHYRELTGDTKVFCLDNHSPWIKWDNNESIFFVGEERQDVNEKIEEMALFLEKNDKSGLNYKKEWVYEFGRGWNKRTFEMAKQIGLMSNSQWCQIQENNIFASTLEVSYANVDGIAWSTDQLRQFGKTVMESIHYILFKDFSSQ